MLIIDLLVLWAVGIFSVGCSNDMDSILGRWLYQRTLATGGDIAMAKLKITQP
jgi:hypothetical protein